MCLTIVCNVQHFADANWCGETQLELPYSTDVLFLLRHNSPEVVVEVYPDNLILSQHPLEIVILDDRNSNSYHYHTLLKSKSFIVLQRPHEKYEWGSHLNKYHHHQSQQEQ